MDTSAYLLDTATAAARAAAAILSDGTASVLSSVGKDVKLDADLRAHEVLLAALKETGIPVLSEEDAEHDFSGERQWVVDPLDGSFNFLRGVPLSAVSVALVERGVPVLGVVYDFARNELFAGALGRGATLNGSAISVSITARKEDAVIMTGFPSHGDFSAEGIARTTSFVQSYKKVRLIGSAALSLSWVSCGRADAYIERGIHLWDVAAGLALVKAAGGDFTMSPPDAQGRCDVSASNGILTEEV